MNSTDQFAKIYFDAWNAHDGGGLARLFDLGGTYVDPTTKIPAPSYDIGAIMESLCVFLPDFAFTVGSQIADGDRLVVEWCLVGKNTGAIKPGIEPTGNLVSLKGVDSITFGPGGILTIVRYYDQRALFEQMGMQIIIEPYAQGKATYGYSKRVASGNRSVPNVFGITWIGFRDSSELDHIRTHSAAIIQSFLEEPGFISIVTGAAGDRAFTVTAWESEESLYRALGKAHAGAKQEFRTGDIAPAVWTSVWQPHHLNRLWTRCMRCAEPNGATDDHNSCAKCQAPLPERPPYW